MDPDYEIQKTQEAARKAVLHELDNKAFGWFHAKAIIVSGVGFFADAYDIFVIGLVVNMLGYIYWVDGTSTGCAGAKGFGGALDSPCAYPKVPVIQSQIMKASTTVGTLIGQFAFGWAGDVLGRKKIYGTELAIMIMATFCCAMAAPPARGVNITTMLSFWRLILGFGIGGDYPLSACLTSEYASTKHRGAMVALVFANQGLGIITSAIVAIICLSAFQSSITADPLNLDYVWRICLALGVVPALAAVYFRTRIAESPRYTMSVEGKAGTAAAELEKYTGKAIIDLKTEEKLAVAEKIREEIKHEEVKPPAASWKEFWGHFGQWKHGKVLLGTSMSWFLVDVAFYGLSLNQSNIVLPALNYPSISPDAAKTVQMPILYQGVSFVFANLPKGTTTFDKLPAGSWSGSFAPPYNAANMGTYANYYQAATAANLTAASPMAAWTNASIPLIKQTVSAGLSDWGYYAYANSYNAAVGNAIIAIMGQIPGYYFACYFVDKWGRKFIQIMGFTACGIVYAILAGLNYELLPFYSSDEVFHDVTVHSTRAWLALFTIAAFFKQFGPNTTTFIIPSEAFPTKFRSTAHGISAAVGKAGAVVGTFAFQAILDSGNGVYKDDTSKFCTHKEKCTYGVQVLFAVCTPLMLLGAAFTFLIPETNGRSLEEINADSEGGAGGSSSVAVQPMDTADTNDDLNRHVSQDPLRRPSAAWNDNSNA
eukprot:NODE_60_length_2346_cov_1522.628211_g46_i0.p1 GENE.NODE_60_length_2346_cov_1522.628211_g46_i0~~NODE_60_length_2346_cov_1522.628211_g46_i0.p1  ORF type:complete len:709 (-),score=265.06 NODE_60_length_2346_cov_1522.628211_g46_i0:122-2248(-)